MSRALESTMRFKVFLAGLALLAALGAPAFARGTLDSILPEIRAAHPGRLSDAQPWTDNEGNTHYRIKWMTPEGRILYFDADQRTGRYSSAGGDNGDRVRDGGGWRGNRGRDEQSPPDDQSSRRSHWNDDGGDGNYGRRGGDGTAWHRGGDRGRGNGGQNWGGWRGGAFGGDNSAHHHHGG